MIYLQDSDNEKYRRVKELDSALIDIKKSFLWNLPNVEVNGNYELTNKKEIITSVHETMDELQRILSIISLATVLISHSVYWRRQDVESPIP